MRLTRTVSFVPTEESDWDLKFQKFKLRRSRSLGTITAEELVERRAIPELWAGFADIFEESRRDGFPSLPQTIPQVPARGLVDELEEKRVFNEDPAAVTNKDLFWTNPFVDTAFGDKVVKFKRQLIGLEEPSPREWEKPFDEVVEATKHELTLAPTAAKPSLSSAVLGKDAEGLDSDSEDGSRHGSKDASGKKLRSISKSGTGKKIKAEQKSAGHDRSDQRGSKEASRQGSKERQRSGGSKERPGSKDRSTPSSRQSPSRGSKG